MSKMKIRVEDGNVIIPVKLLKNIWNTFFSLIFLVICFIAFDYVIAGAGKYTHINPWQWTVPSVTTLLAVNSCAPYASYYSLNVVFNRRFATKRVFIGSVSNLLQQLCHTKEPHINDKSNHDLMHLSSF